MLGSTPGVATVSLLAVLAAGCGSGPPGAAPSATPSPPTTSAPSPTAPAPSCATGTGPAGAMRVCPGSAPVGATVRISATTLCGAPDLRNLTVVFLGSQSYVGSGGGGAEVPGPYRAAGGGFEVDYRVPRSYVSGAQGGTSPKPVAVTPGGGYSFATYPAGGCTVRFTVSPR